MTDGVGTDITSNPVLTPYFAFTGREYDQETGLHFYRARYFDSSLGRFIQEDPHPGNPNDPISVINKYSYGRNSPTAYIDPDGQFFIELLVAAAVGGTISFLFSAFRHGNTGRDNWNAFWQGATIGAAAFIGGYTFSGFGLLGLSQPATGLLWALGAGLAGGYTATRFVRDEDKENAFWQNFVTSGLSGYYGGYNYGRPTHGATAVGKRWNQFVDFFTNHTTIELVIRFAN